MLFSRKLKGIGNLQSSLMFHFLYIRLQHVGSLSIVDDPLVNATGLWEKRDENIDISCKNGGYSSATYPYKNIYCFMCNVDVSTFLTRKEFNVPLFVHTLATCWFTFYC
jgi:hypothetical protein